MIIDKLINNGTLVIQSTSIGEIEDLMKIVERDIEDSAQTEIFHDWQFGIAYNAAIKLANILVRASGLRIKGQGHHMNTISMIPILLGDHKKDDADYLDSCRRKRNIVEYDCVGGATKSDVIELREFVFEFQLEVKKYLKTKKIF